MMQRGAFILLCAAGLAPAQVQTAHEMGSGNAVLADGVMLDYKTVVEPPLARSAFLPVGSGFHSSNDAIQHFVYDRAARSYFGYRMTVAPGDSPKTRQVSFGPMDASQMQDALKAVAGDLPLTPAPLPKYPAAQMVESGDTIALDLMVSPDGRERIVDYLHFRFGGRPPKPAAAMTAEPRDFTVDDGPVDLSMEPPEVLIDGRKFDGYVVMYAPHGGATPWFYFPGQGRYILSLAPHEGFVKSGVARAGRIEFQADGREYEIRLSKPLAGTEKAWNLYVGRDASYLPRPAVVNAVVGSADRLENLLPK